MDTAAVTHNRSARAAVVAAIGYHNNMINRLARRRCTSTTDKFNDGERSQPMVKETQQLTRRLAGCQGVPSTLDAAWEVFEFLSRAAHQFDRDDVPISHGFGFAATAAHAGRNAVGWAPSIPTPAPPPPVCVPLAEADPYMAAGWPRRWPRWCAP